MSVIDLELAGIEKLFGEFEAALHRIESHLSDAGKTIGEGRIPDPIPEEYFVHAIHHRDTIIASLAGYGKPFYGIHIDPQSSLGELKKHLQDIIIARDEFNNKRKLLNGAEIIVRDIELLDFSQASNKSQIVFQAIQDLSKSLSEENQQVAHDVVQGTHPLAVLRTYVFQQNSLSDEAFDQCQYDIVEHFNRDLLRDIDRGRITLPTTRETAEDEPPGDEPRTSVSFDTPKKTTELDPEQVVASWSDVEGDGSSFTAEPDSPSSMDSSENVESTEQPGSDELDAVNSKYVQVTTTPLTRENESTTDFDAGVAETARIQQPPDAEPAQIDPVESVDISQESLENNAAEGENSFSGETQNVEITLDETSDGQHATQNQPDTDDLAQVLPWRFLQTDDPGLAYFAAQALEQLNVMVEAPPAWLIRAAFLGPYIRQENIDACNILRDDLSYSDLRDDIHRKLWYNLLMASATMIPSLLAPNLTNAPTFLARIELPEGFEALSECIEAIRNYSVMRRPIPPSQFSILPQAESELEILQQEAREWLDKAQSFTHKFQEASDVWREWLKNGNPLAIILQAVVANDHRRLDSVEDWVSVFENEKDIPKHIRRFQKKKKKIVGQALQKLIERAQEAAHFGRRWLLLCEESNHEAKTQNDWFSTLLETLNDKTNTALGEIDRYQNQHPQSASSTAAKMAVYSLTTWSQFFAGEIPEIEEEPLKLFYNHVPRLEFPLSEDGLPATSDEGNLIEAKSLLQILLNVQTNGLPTWETAFRYHADRRDHQATLNLLEAMRFSNADKTEHLESTRDRYLASCKSTFAEKAEKVLSGIEIAFSLGILPTEERENLVSRVVNAKHQSKSALQFSQYYDLLDGISKRIEAYRDTTRTSIRARLDNLPTSDRHSDLERIERIIQEGDFLTANDYLERLERNEALPEKPDPNAFDDFFPTQHNLIHDYLHKDAPDWTQVALTLKGANDESTSDLEIGPLSFSSLARIQRNNVAKMIEEWFEASRSHNITTESARTLLSGFGFAPARIELEKIADQVYLQIEMETPDASIVPVPAYGSEANHRFRVLCLWDIRDSEELVSYVREVDYNHALLVFYFGSIDSQTRRDIARLCKERREETGSKFLVIDDVLFLYLLKFPQRKRLKSLFQCTLPFTSTEPYKSTPGYVPPEMFYGREREIKRIIEPDNTSLVYGGRQLGKTALLKHVERLFTEQGYGVSKYIDLNTYGIGRSNAAEQIWPLIVRALKEKGILDEKIQISTPPKKLIPSLQSWLEHNPGQRILLLLDEADGFFESDEQNGYAETLWFKGFMEETDRQFKVVFAGLHNVFRNARRPNQPLHHLQDPICVGPLIEGKDKADAAKLIEIPLGAMGFRFGSEDLIPQILSQTNYYPSLIQLYCRQLIRDLENTNNYHYDPYSTPPFRIEKKHLEKSYRHNDLIQLIRSKFLLTLDLDQRYAVIAYVIAHGILADDPAGNDVVGFSVEWIRGEALYYWKTGFEGGSSREDIEILLDEMVGLGVLRHVNTNEPNVRNYTLRGRNVLSLLGNYQVISDELCKERIPNPVFDPSTYRTLMQNDMLSPLTAKQMGELLHKKHGISVIYGTHAAGLPSIIPFLNEHSTGIKLEVFDSHTDRNDFEKWIDCKIKDSKEELSLFVISSNTPWSREWIYKAEQRIRSIKSNNRFVRVVFLADSDTTWRFAHEEETTGTDHRISSQLGFTIGPWHASALYYWFKSWETTLDGEFWSRISNLTGNWPLLLEHLHQHIHQNPTAWKQCIDDFPAYLAEHASELLAAFGVTQTDQRQILRLIYEWDQDGLGISQEDLIYSADDSIPGHVVSRVINWADHLQLIYPVENNWRLTAPLYTILAAS